MTFSNLESLRPKYLKQNSLSRAKKYRISSHSFRGNYSFLNLEIQRSKYINLRKLFKAGNYSRAETIWGNTVFMWFEKQDDNIDQYILLKTTAFPQSFLRGITYFYFSIVGSFFLFVWPLKRLFEILLNIFRTKLIMRWFDRWNSVSK